MRNKDRLRNAQSDSRVDPHTRCEDASDARDELPDTGEKYGGRPQLVAVEHKYHGEVDDAEAGMSRHYYVKLPATVLDHR